MSAIFCKQENIQNFLFNMIYLKTAYRQPETGINGSA